MQAKVSIIIPVYNGERTIKRAIESCLAQTYQNIEVLVIDNQSTDRTPEIVEAISDERLSFYQLTQKGRALARNEGLKKMTGEYTQFLDADDVLLPEKIKTSVQFLESNRDYVAYSHGIDYYSEEEEFLKVIFPNYRFSDELLAHNIFPIHSLLFRSEEKGEFPEGMDYCEDWLFWVDTLYQKAIYFNLEDIGGKVYIHEDNTMSQTALMSEYELYVQQILKSRFSVTNRALIKNEITLMIVHYFNLEKEKITIDLINQNSNRTYKFVTFLCKLPILKKYLKRRVDVILQKSVYKKGENNEH